MANAASEKMNVAERSEKVGSGNSVTWQLLNHQDRRLMPREPSHQTIG